MERYVRMDGWAALTRDILTYQMSTRTNDRGGLGQLLLVKPNPQPTPSSLTVLSIIIIIILITILILFLFLVD